MYEGYLSAIEEVFGADISVIDRFHVAQHYYDAADILTGKRFVPSCVYTLLECLVV
jgi:transposase